MCTVFFWIYLHFLFSGVGKTRWFSIFQADEGFYTSPYLGWLTDNTASSADIFEFLKPLGVSIVSPSATSVSLSDSPTFFRTVLGDTAISRAIMKLCKSLEFFNIQVMLICLYLCVELFLFNSTCCLCLICCSFFFCQPLYVHSHKLSLLTYRHVYFISMFFQ